MPRFPVAFSKRKSTAESFENVAVTPSSGSSFRVLDRSEVPGGAAKNFDSSPTLRPPAKSYTMPSNATSDGAYLDDKLFTDLKYNRGSGSSNTTKTTSTDNSSRHSNASTAPSSADMGHQQQQFQQQQQDEFKSAPKKAYADIPVPPIPKSSTTSSFLKSAGRTFSFGGQRKHQALSSTYEEAVPETPSRTEYPTRDRAATASTVTTATPPKLDSDFTLDLGGDFGSMLGSFDKRSSGMTIRDDADGRPALAPRSLTGNRLNQPTPIQVDTQAKVEPSPYSWGSHNSDDRLMNSHSVMASPTNENAPPPVPRHVSSYGVGPESPSGPASSPENGLKRSSAIFGRRRSTIDYSAEVEDEDAVLLKDSYSTVNRFLSGASASNSLANRSTPVSGRFRRDEESLGGSAAPAIASGGSGYRQVPTESTSPRFGSKATNDEEDNMFDSSFARNTRQNQRYIVTQRQPPPPPSNNKVMTPAQFERYRKDKEREETRNGISIIKPEDSDNDQDDDAYDDDIDEAEKSRQAAKQRRKQEAHMTVYRQQMMKVTGEAATGTPIRNISHLSMSTPNLPSLAGDASATPSPPRAGSEGSDEDEEVPLGILAAHGFPNKNRPPARLSAMMSNPNLRAAAAPSYQRAGSVMGDSPGNGAAGSVAGGNGRLPPFARNLPQDPYGLVQSSVRESLNYGAGQNGGQQPQGGVPGGLVGVIATEERSRALRRGSPNVDAVNRAMPGMMPGQFDQMGGVPPQMMYPGMGPQQMLSAGDHAQIQMTQQMQQFMQMQMQFMQMMASNNRPMSQYGGNGMTPNGMGPNGMPDMMRHSYADQAAPMDMPGGRPDMHMRTMSMVQPSSASWVQQPNGYAPSIRVQGANGYAPSIAPSERSNIGLPGRYRPVSHMPAGPNPNELRKSMTMSGAIGETANGNASPGASSDGVGAANPASLDNTRKQTNRSPLNNATNADDDDDEQGWAAMKAKRDKKRSIWKSKKSTAGSEISTVIG